MHGGKSLCLTLGKLCMIVYLPMSKSSRVMLLLVHVAGCQLQPANMPCLLTLGPVIAQQQCLHVLHRSMSGTVLHVCVSNEDTLAQVAKKSWDNVVPTLQV